LYDEHAVASRRPERSAEPSTRGGENPVHSFPRPESPHLSVERVPADGTCPACGADALADYRVLSEGGWWDVRKCTSCLHSVSRTPGPLLGSYVPLGLRIMENV
jgi:vanillate/4-hydroxybenzoate decarboxylase subunit D